MLRTIAILIAASFVVAGCYNNDKQEFTKYHEDGRAKPVVAIAPVIDSSGYDVPWSLSEELTSLVLNRMAHKSSTFIALQDDFQNTLSHSQNPFGPDISWVKDNFAPNEFVVFLELLEHENITVEDPNQKITNADLQNTSSNLNMTMRVRIVDIRGNSPKIVLQEVINESYYISKNLIHTNYNLNGWGSEDYLITPLGVAHTQLTKELASRLNEYILLAKSRWHG